jgi:GAF domain-containing protein
LQVVLDEVVEAATLLSGAKNGRLWLFRDGLLQAVANFGLREGFDFDKEPRVPDRTTMAGRAAVTRDVVHLPDVDADPEYTYAGPRPFRSGLNVPILLEDELIGVVGIVRDEVGPFAHEHLELLRSFADQAAIAIANARLLETVERQLEQQRAIAELLRGVARSEGLEAVIEVALKAANRLCESDYGALYMVDGELVRSATQQGGSPEHADYERSHPHTRDRHTLVGRVAVTGQTVHIPDALADPDYSWPGQEMSGYRAMLGVPILVEGELTGVFGLVRNEPKPFTEEQIKLMETFADQASIAIANARLFEAVDRQRTELSRFLSPQVAELISSPQGEQLLAGHRAYITCLFCDLRGFTAFAETAAPEELFDVLRAYHETLGKLIAGNSGTLEHFAGDGVMVFFNDPVPLENHELHAIKLGLLAQERIGELAQAWHKRGIQLGLGIGIEAGYATLGRIGFEGRYDYGTLGPVTNLASRLSSQAREGQTLIGPRVYAAVEEHIDASPIGDLELKGFARPVPAYEVRSLTTVR